MVDVFILDPDLKTLGIIDGYKSLIWTNRFNDLGACELYVQASPQNILLCAEGNYIIRPDDASMVCVITRVELDTDSENGNYLIINGTDSKSLLDRRIIWGTAACNGSVEAFAHSIINTNIINASNSARKMIKSNGYNLITLATLSGLPGVITESVSYANIGEKIREYCKTFNLGYKFTFYDLTFDRSLLFSMYEGTDRTDSVVFSDAYENLISTKYIDDITAIKNTALVAGEGVGGDRELSDLGTNSGVDRYELFVDARDLSSTVTWSELQNLYPGSTSDIYPVSGSYTYAFSVVMIPILSSNHKTWLQENYPNHPGYYLTTITTVGGVEYFRIEGVNKYKFPLAGISTDSPTDTTDVDLSEILYYSLLQARGINKLTEYTPTQTFEGFVIPDKPYKYNQDYYLGDYVKIINSFGIGATAQIIEVTETFDENGYHIDPKFEYQIDLS